MRTIEEFIANLTNDDIDLFDKLDNLCGHGQISDTVYHMALEDDNFAIIENFIKEILQDVWQLPLTERCIDFIVEETKNLYDQELIYDIDDFTGGLYNCDEIYLYAISDALFLEMDELDYYTEED